MKSAITIRVKLITALLALTVSMLGIGIFEWRSNVYANEKFKTVYEDRLVALAQLKAVADDLTEIVSITRPVRQGKASFEDGLAAHQKVLADVNKRWSNYLTSNLDVEEKSWLSRHSRPNWRLIFCLRPWGPPMPQKTNQRLIKRLEPALTYR
jgi:hypothetical protein